MAVPSRREAAAVLAELAPPARFLAHSRAVAELAAYLAARMAARGIALDRHVTEAAGLLHDVDKLLARDDPLRALGHGEASGRWLAERGYPELARAVAAHPVGRLADEEGYRDLMAAGPEVRIVAYADKRAVQRLVPMRARFARWRRRHPDDPAYLDAAWPRALELEAQVCADAGINPSELRRLRWVARALAGARAPGLREGAA